jgi:hypothetical protein
MDETNRLNQHIQKLAEVRETHKHDFYDLRLVFHESLMVW